MDITSGVATCLHLLPKAIEYMFRILSTILFWNNIIHIKVISTNTTISMFHIEAKNFNHRWVPSIRQHGISGIDVPPIATFQWLTTGMWNITGVYLGWRLGPCTVPPMIRRFPLCGSSPICVLPIAELIFHLSTIACDCRFVWFWRQKALSLMEWQRVIRCIIGRIV